MKTEPTTSLLQTLFLLVLSLELSFITSTAFNLTICFFCLFVFLWLRQWRAVILFFLLPILPALSISWAIVLQTQNQEQALVLFSRTYAFAGLGLSFSLMTPFDQLLRYLHQKGLSASFTYGLLIVVNGLEELVHDIKAVKEASLLRGRPLRIWSPLLYLKGIFIANHLRDTYLQALASHGFDENQTRSRYRLLTTPKQSLLIFLSLILLSHLSLLLPF